MSKNEDLLKNGEENVEKINSTTSKEALDPENQEPKINYNDFGYRTNETVPIPSVLFYEILALAAIVEQDKTTVYYEDRATVEETFSDQNTPVRFLDNLGMKAKALRYQLNQTHMSNVDNGIATPISVLQKEAEEAKKPAVTLDEEVGDAVGD